MSEWKFYKSRDEKLFKYESWRKGQKLIILETKEEIIDVYNDKENTDIFILGNGTNILFTDEYMDKILFVQKLNKIEDLGKNLVKVETGANLKDLTDFMKDKIILELKAYSVYQVLLEDLYIWMVELLEQKYLIK